MSSLSQQQQRHSNDTATNEPMITILSSDDVVFTLPRNAAKCSDLIADIINIDHDSSTGSMNHNNNGDTASASVEQQQGYKLERVSSRTLAKVVEFLIYYYSHPMEPIPDVVLCSFIENIPQEWYRTFCAPENMDLSLLFDIREAADYLLIKPLINLTNAWLTFQIIGKSATEIHELLNVCRSGSEYYMDCDYSHRRGRRLF